MANEGLMILHTVLFMTYIVIGLLDYILMSYTIKFYEEKNYRKSCHLNFALDLFWCLTEICATCILILQIYMSSKFSEPAETYKSRFLLVYQTNQKRVNYLKGYMVEYQ